VPIAIGIATVAATVAATAAASSCVASVAPVAILATSGTAAMYAFMLYSPLPKAEETYLRTAEVVAESLLDC